jgi:glycosyltransferase involved in cell wall biosynthesis
MVGAFHLYLKAVKKIIFTVTNDLNYDQRMQRICGTLADAGYDVLLVGRKLRTSLVVSNEKYKQHRLNCWFSKGKNFYAEFNIRLFFYLLFRKADCICSIDLDTILAGYYVSRIKKIIRVYDAHEYFSQLDEVISRPNIYRFWHRIERKLIPKFPNGYTVCDSLATEFKKNYNVDYKVIRNLPLLADSNNQVKNKVGVVLYQGAVNRGRGLDKIVLAMKNVNAQLWVCGHGNFMEEMKATVQANDLSAKILFFGLLKPDVLKERTAQAYIAINPFEKTGLNQYLSLSNKFFDYIHAGLPQVTMNYPEYRRINDQYKIADLIDDLNPETIAKGISNLLDDEELYLQLKKNCSIAKQDLNWQNEKGKLLNFYHQLFNE